MRHPTALTHCALTCCVMWGILFGSLVGAALVVLPSSETYVTPEMYGGGAYGFRQAVTVAVREQKMLDAPFTYNHVGVWHVPSHLHARVHRLPDAQLHILDATNVSIVVEEAASLNVANVQESSLSVGTATTGTCDISQRITDTTLHVQCGAVRVRDADVRESSLVLLGKTAIVGSLLSIKNTMQAANAHIDHDVVGSTALIESTFNLSQAACHNASAVAFQRLFFCHYY